MKSVFVIRIGILLISGHFPILSAVLAMVKLTLEW